MPDLPENHSMQEAHTRDRWSKFGKWAGLAAFSFFLAKGILWLAIPSLILGSCAK
jgi:hypothetical protein